MKVKGGGARRGSGGGRQEEEQKAKKKRKEEIKDEEMRSCCDIIISCIFSRRLVSQLQFYKSKQGAHFSNKPDLNRAVMKCSAATGRDRRSEIKKEKKKTRRWRRLNRWEEKRWTGDSERTAPSPWRRGGLKKTTLKKQFPRNPSVSPRRSD